MRALEQFLEDEGFTEAEVLGEGSSATVLVAFSETEGFDVALKVLSRDLKEFEVENKILLELEEGKRIIKRYRTITAEDMQYAIVVLEMLDHDLMDTIEATGSIPETRARVIFYDICRAVLFCHNKHIAHLDIKPENILLDKNEKRAVLTDFGTAVKFEPREPVKTNPVGTFFYCAPEITHSQGCYPARADIWSLGILLHVILTGTWPFAGNSYDEACENAEKGVVHCLKKKLSESALELIESMLVIDSSKRVNIAQVLEHRWFNPLARRQSEMEQRLAFDLDLPSPASDRSPRTPRTPRSVFMEGRGLDSPRTSKIDLSSCLSPRVATLNEVPVSLKLSQLDLKSKTTPTNGLKTPRQSDSLTPRITPDPKKEPTTEELEQLDKKKPPGTLSSLFKRVKDITSFKKN